MDPQDLIKEPKTTMKTRWLELHYSIFSTSSDGSGCAEVIIEVFCVWSAHQDNNKDRIFMQHAIPCHLFLKVM
jgi:hypothetical protein